MADFGPNDPRTVWQNDLTEVPRVPPIELRARLARLDADLTRKSRARFIGLSFNSMLFVALAFVFQSPMERVGCVMTALGWFAVVWQLRRYGLAAPRRAVEAAGVASIDFYRANLQRERDFAAAWPWFLVAVPGPLVFMMAIALQHPELSRSFFYIMLCVLAALVAGGVAGQISRGRRWQRELDAVERWHRADR